MSGKHKILITLGCSYTEGIGCYDIDLMQSYNVNDYNSLPKDEYISQMDKFHRDGFPNKLGKLLNYNKVINMGLGGSGTSGQLKRFIEKFDTEKFENSEVLLFWYLSEPSRYSFYIQDEVRDQQMALPLIYQLDFDKYFISQMDLENDTLKEQIFYIKTMNHICKSKGWNYLISHSQEFFQKKIESLLHDKDYVLPFDGDGTMKIISDEHKSKYCAHPNEFGYEVIANRIYNKILIHKPHLISNEIPTEFEWEWLGK